MAGHKRPNGSPICPKVEPPSPPISSRRSPLRRTNLSIIPFEIPPDGNLHRKNPNYVEPPSAPESVVEDDSDSLAASWVPTELAEGDIRRIGDIRLGGPEALRALSFDKDDDGDDDAQSDGSSSHDSSVSSRIKRSISSFLMTSTPLASLFSTPKKDVPALADAARRRGLFVGMLHPRRNQDLGRRIKREPDEGIESVSSGVSASSRLVVMGRDAETVDLLLNLEESGLRGHAERHEARSRGGGLAGAYPIDVHSIRMTFFDAVVAGAVGGCFVWYALSIM